MENKIPRLRTTDYLEKILKNKKDKESEMEEYQLEYDYGFYTQIPDTICPLVINLEKEKLCVRN